jgi:molecular chaperone GrpE
VAAENNGMTEKPEVVEDALSKELDEKNKEIIDLKVPNSPHFSFLSLFCPNRLNSLEETALTNFGQDKYLRSVADFRNLQERTKREIESARAFAIQKFATDLIESVDNIERALSTVPADKLAGVQEANKDFHDLFQGLKMTENVLMTTLKKHGLERFDPIEDSKLQKFDPRIHEATFMAKVEDKEDGDIMHTQSKGFRLNGRVLRVSLASPTSITVSSRG